jgi:hypothetical protein
MASYRFILPDGTQPQLTMLQYERACLLQQEPAPRGTTVRHVYPVPGVPGAIGLQVSQTRRIAVLPDGSMLTR